jgi:ASC-1-like (ASCH) protein
MIKKKDYYYKYKKYKIKYLKLLGGNSTTYKKNVSEPWFTLIKEGRKTVEGRLNKGEFAQMRAGDTIIWTNNDDSFKTKIKSIQKYNTFYEYLEGEGIKSALPVDEVQTVKDGVDVYYKYYTREEEEKYGVLAVRLELLK